METELLQQTLRYYLESYKYIPQYVINYLQDKWLLFEEEDRKNIHHLVNYYLYDEGEFQLNSPASYEYLRLSEWMKANGGLTDHLPELQPLMKDLVVDGN